MLRVLPGSRGSKRPGSFWARGPRMWGRGQMLTINDSKTRPEKEACWRPQGGHWKLALCLLVWVAVFPGVRCLHCLSYKTWAQRGAGGLRWGRGWRRGGAGQGGGSGSSSTNLPPLDLGHSASVSAGGSVPDPVPLAGSTGSSGTGLPRGHTLGTAGLRPQAPGRAPPLHGVTPPTLLRHRGSGAPGPVPQPLPDPAICLAIWAVELTSELGPSWLPWPWPRRLPECEGHGCGEGGQGMCGCPLRTPPQGQ